MADGMTGTAPDLLFENIAHRPQTRQAGFVGSYFHCETRGRVRCEHVSDTLFARISELGSRCL
jgi:hypothetical protein